jgi:hypothetical protein
MASGFSLPSTNIRGTTPSAVPTVDPLSAAAVLAQQEGAVPRARLSERTASTLARKYLMLADAAHDEALRLALLADAIRLLDGPRGLARAAEHQAAVVRGLVDVDVDADLRCLAWLNWVELRQAARQQRLGMPPPNSDDVDAIEGLLAASASLSAPFPRLLALEMQAAALWARAAWDQLAVVVDALVECSPIRWRTALHRAHLALAIGDDDAAASALADAQAATLPDELQAYVWGLLAGLATKRGDGDGAARFAAKRSAAGSLLAAGDAQVPVWSAPTFVFAEEPRYELAVELWRRVDGGHAHAQFIARRLWSMDPHAQWRRMQASELGVAPWRPHDALVAQLVASTSTT